MKNLIQIVTISLILLGVQSVCAQQEVKGDINHGPYLQNLSGESVTIVFSSNKDVLPGILISTGTQEPRLIRNSTDGLLNVGNGVHKVKINGLEEGTPYKYRVMAVEIIDHQAYSCTFGDTLYSEEFSFKTFTTEKEQVKFTMFCDVHDKPAKIGNYLEQGNINEQDFYLLNGDIIGHVDNEEQIYHNFVDTCTSIFASRIPMYYVRGNHETRGSYARNLKNYFDFEGDNFYYAFSQGNIRFIVLDTGEDKPDGHGEYFGLVDFDAFRAEQLEWLKKEIASPEFREAKAHIVFGHMPILKLEKSWHGMAQLAEHFGPVLKNAGIDLMLCGHVHQNWWVDASETGFDYPLMTCSSNDFLETVIDKEQIQLWIKNEKGEILEYKIIQLNDK